MIFKVLYQQKGKEVPVRENTDKLYYEAENERQVRKDLDDRDINIEYIQPLEGNHLAYEQASEDFKVENA
ncbi:DNA-dependent RNA polymerase auxiliary subunit epsilon [Pelagirhabdus alkalitolerans]|uniref:DNA-directed RNA polymerase subunit epsilon n=1 Tax=Pelagirhabdus alkalitolerans TaxID=1612202 RepID=A0A1G6GYU0_9BACI|nr:DNA-directed RNA polymerase subunit epsilon [Pelagirhabdus alkalitolerans]SDB87169.1 DNA-dependent RNA polymerase auxiliary subunit epsilon [Pelagirhabdus alkalitolerans]